VIYLFSPQREPRPREWDKEQKVNWREQVVTLKFPAQGKMSVINRDLSSVDQTRL